MRSRTFVSVVTVAALVALAASARADFAANAVVTEFLPGDFVDNAAQDTTRIAAADGVFVFDKTGVNPLGGSFVDLDAVFSNPNQTALEAHVYTGAVTGAYLTGVSFFNTANGSSASALGLTPSQGALLGNSDNVFAFTLGGGGPFALSTIGAFATYDHMALTFAFDNAGDRLALDAVANPEPGAWALFALGTVGLGTFVWRRRTHVVRPA